MNVASSAVSTPPGQSWLSNVKKLIAIVDKKELPSINIRILFDYDLDRIKESSYSSLDVISTALLDEALEDSRIMLNGHTDAVGSRIYNQDLSERRALSVKHYLTQVGHIPEYRRVEIVNLGK
ncbi:MAG: OmpA family protein [Hyphomicrobiales bacterium]|nr:OmpA family protein [Hyphomicrobiales bacterium]